MDKTAGHPASVNPQAVIQILTSRISALTLENAMLQARVIELEGQLRAGAAAAKEQKKQGGKEKGKGQDRASE